MRDDRAEAGQIIIDTISTLPLFKDLEGVWNDLLGRSGSDNPFLTFEWLVSWWEAFGRRRDLLVLVARKNGDIIGIAPLMGHRSFMPGCKVPGVEFIGAPDADYHDFIVLEDREKVIELFLRTILQARRHTLLRFSEIPEDSPNLAPLRRVLSGATGLLRSEHVKTRCHYIPVDPDLSWDERFRGLKSNMRASLKRLLNRYGEVGELELAGVSSEDVRDSLRELSFHHVRGWGRRGRPSVLENPAHLDFLESLYELLSKKGWMEFSRLHVGGRLVGIHYGFGYKGTYYYYLVSYSDEFSRYSPGKVLLYSLLREAHRRGFELLDLLRGTESYKASWTERSRPNYEVMAFRRNSSGAVSYLWFEKAKPLLVKIAILRSLRERWRSRTDRRPEEGNGA